MLGALGQFALGQLPSVGGIVAVQILADYAVSKRRKKPQKERIDWDIEREHKLHADLWAAFHPPESPVTEPDIGAIPIRLAPDVTQLAKIMVNVGDQNRTKRMKSDQDDDDAVLAMILEDIA